MLVSPSTDSLVVLLGDVMVVLGQRICTGRNEHGVASPRTPNESRSTIAYSKWMWEELGWFAYCLGFTAGVWTDEVNRAGERLDRLMRERRRG